jgi:hypothetical protein
VGVCLSGGGIRSAAFGLGALQVLRARKRLDKARYLAAVSGGGYLAAGWAVADAGPPDDGDPNDQGGPRWGPGSPEERWFRDHASYLVPDAKGGFAGLARLLAGVLVNLALIGLVLFAVARPVGWVMHELHDNLHATDPTVVVRDSVGEMQVGPVSLMGTVDNGAEPPITRYAVILLPADDVDANRACFDWAPYEPGDCNVHVRVESKKPGIVDVQKGKATIVAQPEVRVAYDEPDPSCDTDCTKVRQAAFVWDQPEIGMDEAFVVDEAAPTSDRFTVKRQATVSVRTGLAGMSYPDYEWWMWEFAAGLLVAALLVAFAGVFLRLRGRQAVIGRALAKTLGGAGLGAFLVIIALPWLVVWLPRTFASLVEPGTRSTSGSGLQDYFVPGGGLLAALAAAARQFLAGAQDKKGSGTGDSKPWYHKLWGGLSKRKAELKWYETSPTKILLAVVYAVAMVVAFVNALQFATANGIDGKLMGFAFVRDYLPYWLWLTEWAKLAVVVVGLGVFALAADAQSWSLYPFYKARLSSAFILRRKVSRAAEPIPYDILLPYTTLTKPKPGPQLVTCCAVNLNEYGVVPPGRRAASFTFSSTEIGGPLVGYATPQQYAQLPFDRRRDVTVPSGMAISGAAFSPAMGKFNLGPIGSVLALANLRLGVWIPHPCYVRDRSSREWDWWRFRRPHWVWYLRELANKYAFNRRYLYVSDGGHWDNLGLVELLRRGCTEIYCVSGAGDGPTSFGTIGEAIALAREEVGVEFFEFDPSPLRAPVGGPATPPARQLRRGEDKDKVANFAGAAAVAARYRFTRTPGAEGVIYYVEADLTADMPFDVHTFAEAELAFPDDSTGDQVFNHRQFESYRALGAHQMREALDLPPPPPLPTGWP